MSFPRGLSKQAEPGAGLLVWHWFIFESDQLFSLVWTVRNEDFVWFQLDYQVDTPGTCQDTLDLKRRVIYGLAAPEC